MRFNLKIDTAEAGSYSPVTTFPYLPLFSWEPASCNRLYSPASSSAKCNYVSGQWDMRKMDVLKAQNGIYLKRDCVCLFFHLLLGTWTWWQVMLDHGMRTKYQGQQSNTTKGPWLLGYSDITKLSYHSWDSPPSDCNVRNEL